MVTVTEALSQIKLIEKKIESKKTTIMGNLTRFEQLPDPLGDGKEALKREMQAIEDLYTHLNVIRSKIAKANLENSITINGKTETIYGWLVWKREVSEKLRDFYQKIHSSIKANVDQHNARPQVFKNETTGEVKLTTLVTNLSYQDYITKHEQIQDLIEKLDGQLSLKNATITVEI